MSPLTSARRHGLHEMPSVGSPHQAKVPNGTREGERSHEHPGRTLQRRGSIELPMWPVAVLVVALIAATIGMTMLGTRAEDGVALAPALDPIMVNGEPCMQCR